MAIILFVDDDPFRAAVYKAALDEKFMDVRRVRYPFEALLCVEHEHLANHLQLVIYSHSMHGIGGPDFVKELHERLQTIKVLILGCPQEDEQRYPEGVRFVPLSQDAHQLLPLVSEILPNPQQHKTWNPAA